MKFGSYNAGPWIRFHGGWYIVFAGKGQAVISCYHDMYEGKSDEEISYIINGLKICKDNIYYNGKKVLWDVELRYEVCKFQEAFDSFYDKKLMTEDEIKVVVENFLERINKLTAFF